MIFFRSHFQRRSNSRTQKSSVSNTPQASAHDLPSTDAVAKVELTDLFRQAFDAPTSSVNPQNGPSKPQPSLFQKLVKYRVHSTSYNDFLGKAKRVPRQTNLETLGKDAITEKKVHTPDLISDEDYDSDAQYISSPQFSSQSWMSFHSRSRQTEKSDASRSLGSDEKIMSILPDSDFNPLASSQHQRISSLAIPKRRSAVSHLTPKNRTRSLGTNVLQDTESCTSQNDPVGTSTPEVKSKFTELFNFRKREYEDSNDSTRKVSIGWMTEGKRLGYGYSFVKGEEPDKATTKTSPASNSPCKSANNGKKASAQTHATKDVDQIINIKVQAKEAVKLGAENQETYSKRHSRLPKFVSNPTAETN